MMTSIPQISHYKNTFPTKSKIFKYYYKTCTVALDVRGIRVSVQATHFGKTCMPQIGHACDIRVFSINNKMYNFML